MIYPLELPSLLFPQVVQKITQQFQQYLQQGLEKMMLEFSQGRKISQQSISNFSDSSTNNGHSIGNSKLLNCITERKSDSLE